MDSDHESNRALLHCLGQLFYAIAASDGEVRMEERAGMIRNIGQEWNAAELVVIQDTFDQARSHNRSAEQCFHEFEGFVENSRDFISDSLKKKIIKTAWAVASSFAKNNKHELTMLTQLRELLYPNSDIIKKIKMDKRALKEYLISQQRVVVKDLKATVDSYRAGADLDESDTLDPEDYSHQTESGDLGRSLLSPLAQAKEGLSTAEDLNTGACDTIQPGALVELKDMWIYVSISHPAFDFRNVEITPISTEAPIYLAMHGLKAGDEFTRDGRTTRIITVL